MFDKSMQFSSSKRQTVKYVMYKITIARFLNAVSSVFDFRSRGGKFESQLGLITFMEIDHEMISAVTPHPNLHWFMKGSCQLLVKACGQVLVNHLKE